MSGEWLWTLKVEPEFLLQQLAALVISKSLTPKNTKTKHVFAPG